MQQEGHEVVAGFMKNYVSDRGNCTTYNDSVDAIKVAEFLGIEIRSFDLQKEYQERIIDYIYAGYQKGITPNPDVLCNSLIKFDVFWRELWNKGLTRLRPVTMLELKNIKKKIEEGCFISFVESTTIRINLTFSLG